MFRKKKKLKTLDLSNFSATKVYNMKEMFLNCVNITEINLSNFNCINVNDMDKIFKGCTKLKKLEMPVIKL